MPERRAGRRPDGGRGGGTAGRAATRSGVSRPARRRASSGRTCHAVQRRPRSSSGRSSSGSETGATRCFSGSSSRTRGSGSGRSSARSASSTGSLPSSPVATVVPGRRSAPDSRRATSWSATTSASSPAIRSSPTGCSPPPRISSSTSPCSPASRDPWRANGRRRAPLGFVRPRRDRGLRGRERGIGELRAADRRRGSRVPASTLAARARGQPPAVRPARRDGPARAAADRGALEAGHLVRAAPSRPPSPGWSR